MQALYHITADAFDQLIMILRLVFSLLWRNVEDSFSESAMRHGCRNIFSWCFCHLWSLRELPFPYKLDPIMNRLQHCTIRHLNTFELLWACFSDVDKSVLYNLVENNVQKLNLLNKCFFLQNSNLASCYMTNCKRILLIWVTHAAFTCNSAFGVWVQRT